MKGKIFEGSNSVEQDQAKVLFDYYLKAADKIVNEEIRIENEIDGYQQEKQVLEDKKSQWWYWLAVIFTFGYYKRKIERRIADFDESIDILQEQHRNIFRDYKVTKLGVAYVPVSEQIKYNDRSFMVDYTGQVPDYKVTLEMSRQTDLLVKTIGDMNKLASEAPIVETSEDCEPLETADYSTSIQEVNMHDYMGGMERALRTITYCMNDLETVSVDLPLVEDRSSYLRHIEEYGTDTVPAGAPVVQVFDTHRYDRSIDKFKELNKLKDSLSNQTQQFEDVLRSLISTLASSIQAVSALKIASVDKVVSESNRLLYTLLKAPYNHYSPMLEFDEIERIRNEKFDYTDLQGYEPFNLKVSSRVKYNPLTGQWVAEDGSVTSVPFGVHQIYEEILAPVVEALMQENRIKRLDIYNAIKDQKLSYLNKWHQDTEAFYRANRAESSDIINLMSEGLRQYVAAYNTLVSMQRTEESMVQSDGELDSTVVKAVENSEETLAAFELQSREFQNSQIAFEEYMERLKDDIDRRAEEFGHVEYYDAKLRDGHANEAATASSEAATFEERRKGLATANPLLAKRSELPPEPNIEAVTFEQLSINLPSIAKIRLEETAKMPATPSKAPATPVSEVTEPMPSDEPEEESTETASRDLPPIPGTDTDPLPEDENEEDIEEMDDDEDVEVDDDEENDIVLDLDEIARTIDDQMNQNN